MKISGSRILVTGAGGFIGGAAAARLEAEGARVRGLVRRPDADVPAGVERFAGDLDNPEQLAAAAAGCDAVVHTAARHITPGPRSEFEAINVKATETLVRLFGQQAGAGSRFVHLSTINVHGLPPPAGANAKSPLCYSGDAYSDSKVDGERAAWRAAREFDVPLTVIRPACTYGPRGRAWTMIPFERIRAGHRVLIGKGEGICNAVYIDNLVDLIIRVLESESAAGQAFIGSEGRGVTWRDFYGAYARMIGGIRLRSLPYWPTLAAGELSMWYGRIRRRPELSRRANIAFYTHRVVFDAEPARRLLGYVPAVGLEEGMQHTERWLRQASLL